MIRKHWYKPRFWAWWWVNRAPDGLRMLLVVAVCGASAGAGYMLASRVSAAHASTLTSVAVRTVRVTVKGATVERTLTVREKGRIVRTTVPVVHKVVTPGKTSTLTTTVYVTRNVFVPVTNTVAGAPVTDTVAGPPVTDTVAGKAVTDTVTVSGPTHTVVQTQVVPTVVTSTNVVTHQVTQTVVQVVTG